MKYLPNALNLSAVKTSELTKTGIKNKFSQKTSSTAWLAPKKDVVVIDSRVENYEQLIGGVKAGTEVFVLNLVQDAIGQITEILGDRTNINTLHIVSHGQEAALKLGLTELNIQNLESYRSQLQQWGKALSKSASILLYGCNVAAGESCTKTQRNNRRKYCSLQESNWECSIRRRLGIRNCDRQNQRRISI
jgi:hypothetical protein